MTQFEDLEKIKKRLQLQEAIRMNKGLAQSFIDALRYGTSPIRGATLLAVGRHNILKEIQQELNKVSRGESALRVISGDWGTGKSLTLRILQEYAFQQKFATSFVTLTPRECPLYDLRTVYQHIVKNIRTEDCFDHPALEWILKGWADSIRKYYSYGTTGKLPWSLLKISRPFKQALIIYFDAMNRNNYILAEKVLSWMYGDMGSSLEARQSNLPDVITSGNALEMLGDLNRMIRELGLGGLVILFDEAETIPSIYGTTRLIEAFQNLNRLANAAGTTPYSYFVYATTPYFFDHLPDHNLDGKTLGRQTTFMQNLDRSELVELAFMIKDTYLEAYDWSGDPRTQDKKIDSFVECCVVELGEKVTPRFLVRSMVKCLDLCYENPDISILKNLLQTLSKETY